MFVGIKLARNIYHETVLWIGDLGCQALVQENSVYPRLPVRVKTRQKVLKVALVARLRKTIDEGRQWMKKVRMTDGQQ